MTLPALLSRPSPLRLLTACSKPIEPTAIEGASGAENANIGKPDTASPIEFDLLTHPHMATQGSITRTPTVLPMWALQRGGWQSALSSEGSRYE